jgi:hypothetical protein
MKNKKIILTIVGLMFVLIIAIFTYFTPYKQIRLGLSLFKKIIIGDIKIENIFQQQQDIDKQAILIDKLRKKNSNYSYNEKYFPTTQFLKLSFEEILLPKGLLKHTDRKKPNFAKGTTSKFYIDLNEKNDYLLIFSSNLKSYKINTENLIEKKILDIQEIENNLNKNHEITDTMFYNDVLYVATFDKNSCKAHIFESKNTKDILIFENFTEIRYSKNCYEHATGGRLAIKNNQLIFTSDSFEFNNDKNIINMYSYDHLGAVYSIDLETKKINILSSGHRNSQGLIVIDDNYILITEHGPRGGDEINKIIIGKDYGWPKASYGEPYGTEPSDLNFSLKKNHNINNFEEPIFAFVPSIGISQIIEINKNFSEKWKNAFLVTSLNAGSLFKVNFDKDFNKIITFEKIYLGKRIRDITYHKKKKLFILALEDDNGSIGLISSN